ncbi:ead/Ea22-like family protein [Enterobacter ludwigii]|uniref:ead/Ea22-like family protein n=1 Tax=Enterobacter ludwigii TaxID=299767 RepID=UPI0019547C1D|nr:ead/Ea22-like family protein [Enterobacter ludwigii]
MSNIDKQARAELRKRYTPPEIPKCSICGGELSIQRCGGGEPTVYACDGYEADPENPGMVRRAAGRDIADKHYEESRYIDWKKGGDSDVVALLDELEAKDKRIAELESDNAYIKNRHKELDLLIGKNILVMQAAIIEWQGTGDARKGLAWIYNTLWGPGELPDESEKDAQAYFDRKYAPLDEELMALHRWFWEQSEAERAAAAGKGEAS